MSFFNLSVHFFLNECAYSDDLVTKAETAAQRLSVISASLVGTEFSQVVMVRRDINRVTLM